MDLYIEALIDLHAGLKRQGPGDNEFSKKLLNNLPPLPSEPKIADLGCGSGAGSLILAEWFQSPILAVDIARPFLDDLVTFAEQNGISHLIHPVEANIADLDWPENGLDLIWSEGAAYNLTFEGALKYWRPFLKSGGLAVISEISWFTDPIPEEPMQFWQEAYPAMNHEQDNADIAENHGYEVLRIERLPSDSWWKNYYNPLKERIEKIRTVLSPAFEQVIEETHAEMSMFERFSENYGYSFYVLKAV